LAKTYSETSGTNGFVIGVSGGIDSSVTSTLIALTGKPVLCVEMPIHQAPSQVSRAANHIEWLMRRFPNVQRVDVELTNVFEGLINALPEPDGGQADIALVNTRARIRMTTLYYFAGMHGYLVAGTGNKVEDLV